MPQTVLFSEGDVVGFHPKGIGKAERAVLATEGVEKYGYGPFRVEGMVEDRNGTQLQIKTDNGEDPIFPLCWFVAWEIHPDNPQRM